ncbi:MAG: serine/threonine protein kinase [Verrucomicrobia bacterium]|nr:serine/threonine protein kinase [Verrucomicrobiota bacterium]
MKEGSKSLKMVTCGGCGAKNFIPSDLPAFDTTPCHKCGHPVMITVKLRQFELRAVIASGGMGTVFRAWDTMLHREVAVKLMKPELAADPHQVEQFAREARACAGLNHTNIIHIYTFDQNDNNKYLVMELADCGTLDSRIEKEGRVEELYVLDVGIKIASALDAALKHNLLHLDIKPGNILFNSDGEPKLVDFGLAQAAEAERKPEDGVFGTPYYIAPERIRDQREDFRSDMYSLAGTLYHALTGRVPFEAPTIQDVAMAHVNQPLVPPDQIVDDVSQQTNDAIVCAMAKNPEDRYMSYADFGMALEAARSYLLVKKFRPGQ